MSAHRGGVCVKDTKLSQEANVGSPFGYFQDHAGYKEEGEVQCFGGKNTELFLLSSTL